jgi:ADP-ribose pyrophosphatase YjhB (NUDIX family)
MAGVVNGSAPIRCLPATEDKFNGVLVDILQFPSKDVSAFVDALRVSLEQWKSQGKKGVWLKLPIEFCEFMPPAIKAGLTPHHAEATYVMFVMWLGDEPSTLPANASHTIGVGAFVLNDNGEILAVMEKFGLFTDKWKMPSGVINQGEDIFAGASREVKEETGIETEFIEVIGFRQSHNGAFGKSDFYFLCVLRPLTSAITVQTEELVDAKWVPLAEFKAQPYLRERKMLGRMLDACIESSTAPARKGFRLENVQAGTPRAPQYFYNNTSQ